MSKTNLKVRLQNLLVNELSSPSNDKNQVISAYNSLIDIIEIPQISEQLHGYHEIFFQCISQIVLTPLNQFLDDGQLQQLLEKASNACVLSMSQNQIIDGWLLNIEDRAFEKPDDDDEDEDDDDLYEDATESEEEEEEEVITAKRGNSRGRGNQREQKKTVHFDYDTKSASSKEISSSVSKPIANQRNPHVAHVQTHRGGHQNSERSNAGPSSTRGNHNRGARGNTNTTNADKVSDNSRAKGRRAPPFDNKYGVDLSLYDCYICGEYGHVQYDCPKKQDNTRKTSRGGTRNKKSRNRAKSTSSSSSVETTRTETDQNKLQYVYNQSSKLLNSSQTPAERNQTFESFLSSIETLEKQNGENLPKLFREKESNFYSLFCHIAQNDFLFTNEQYSKLYHYKNILLPKQQCLLNEDRSIFCRQRILIPLNAVTEHIQSVTQIQQTIFNDFQEHIIRSTPPISKVLYDLITFLLKSNIHIDMNCFDNFTKRILFDLKKSIFSIEQIDELQSCISIRTKRFQRNNQKQIWKERLNLFKNDQLTVDLNQWIDEFEQVLITNDNEQRDSSTVAVDHAMWYFAVLIMASSGHLNAEQYKKLLNCAIQSGLFNPRQRFHFQVYLNQGQAPITIKELNEIKTQLKSENLPEKESAYKQIIIILDRSKPDFDNQQSSPEVNDLTQSKQSEDIIPIIDNHVLSRLIFLVEMICSDADTFSMEQCTYLLNKILHQSSIVRPLAQADQKRLTTYYSRPISLNELKKHCLTIPSDLNDFILLLKNRIATSNEEIFDFLTETIVKILQNRRKYSNDKCQELKSSIDKRIFGKKRYQLINEIYQKFRVNQTDFLPINPIILNQFLTKILAHDYQAHLEFFTLLEELCHSMDFNEITIEFEINRGILSTIILVITEADFTNSTNVDFFRQRLRKILEDQTEFFLLLLTEQQFQLVSSRLTSTSNIDSLIDLIRADFNEKNWTNFIDFIRNELNEKNDFQKMVNFILETFDNQILSIEQTLQITNLIFQHSKLNNKSLKNILEFLLDLLQLNIHSSPKVFLNLIEHNQENKQTIDQILIILNAKNGKHAIADWKKTMIQLLKLLSDRSDDHQQLINIAQQSPMFQMPIFKQQLEAYFKQTSDENKVSVVSKAAGINDQSAAHREMFRCLESDDASMHALVVQQLRAYLVDEQLSSEISLAKFIQALQIIFRNPQKFAEISLDEWSKLVVKNRGKIFSNDAQCDELLLNILFVRLNMPTDTLRSLQRLIQSKKAHERHEGLEKLLLLLNNTQMTKDKNKSNHLPTISDPLYDIITRVVFDQKFNDTQVRKCMTASKNSWLLNNDHRQKLNL